ncbi:hypothetical protein SCAR479_11774 [Seiridium cardinale]|uniref:Uncharacterized protein n=1 Tax=Seiridium cardinale TaxID=138064 RepID=A0ABR2XCM2_9PEZI
MGGGYLFVGSRGMQFTFDEGSGQSQTGTEDALNAQLEPGQDTA